MVCRPQIKFNIAESMAVHFVVVRQAVNRASGQADKKVMIVLNAVLVCRCFRALSIKVPPANETAVDVVVGKGYATDFLEVEVE